MAMTDAERQAARRDRMKDRGYVQVSFLVPADRLSLVKRLAARLRAKHDAGEPSE